MTTAMKPTASNIRDTGTTGRSISPELSGLEACLPLLVASLPFAQLSWHERRCARRCRSVFRESWDRLTRSGTDDLRVMVRGVYLAAAEDRTQRNLVDMARLADREAQKALGHAPPLSGDPEAFYVPEAPPAELYRRFASALGRRAVEVTARAALVLEHLRERGIVGRVQWHHKGCSFTHSRVVITDAERNGQQTSDTSSHTRDRTLYSRTETTTVVRTERLVTTKTALHTITQRIAYPDTHPAPAKNVAKPHRIARLEAAVPAWLKPTYIVGDLCDVSVYKEGLGSKSDRLIDTAAQTHVSRKIHWDAVATVGLGAVTLLAAVAALPLLVVAGAGFALANDPALVVGDGYVLSGWLPDELPLARRYEVRKT